MQTPQQAMRERMRASTINVIGRAHGRRDLADRAIIAGTPIETFERQLLEQIAEVERENGVIGLTRKEIAQYSLANWIEASLHKTGADTFEGECHRAVCKQIGRSDDGEPNRLLIPHEILTRDLNVATPGAGGYLVDSSVNVGFTAGMRARSITGQLGVQVLGGLRGSSHVPKISQDATAEWLTDELDQVIESQQTFADVGLEPHTVACYVELSHQVVKQATPSIEGIMMFDLGGLLGQTVDVGVVNGSGNSGQPLGILATSGIGAFTGTSLDYDALVNAQLDVALADSILDPNGLGYMTTPTVASLLKGRQRFTGTDSPLWRGAIHAGEIEGVLAFSSTSMPDATMLYGDWSSVLSASGACSRSC